MSDSSKYTQSYSTSDIEKYLGGELSPEEMHALEKAALDDPLLQDALEGVAKHQNADPDFHLRTELAELASRVERSFPGKKRSLIFRLSPAIRIAASVILLLGLGGTAWYLYNRDQYKSGTKNAAYFLKDSISPSAMAKVDTSPALTPSNGYAQPIGATKSFLSTDSGSQLIARTDKSKQPASASNPRHLKLPLSNNDREAVAESKSRRLDSLLVNSNTISSNSTFPEASKGFSAGLQLSPTPTTLRKLSGLRADSSGAMAYNVQIRRDTTEFRANKFQPQDKEYKKNAVGSGYETMKDIPSASMPVAKAGPPARLEDSTIVIGYGTTARDINAKRYSNARGYTNPTYGYFSGQIVDANKQPVPGAILSFHEGKSLVSATTDANGQFNFLVSQKDSLLHLKVDYLDFEQGGFDLDPTDYPNRFGNSIFLHRRPDSLQLVLITRAGSFRPNNPGATSRSGAPGESALQGAIPKGGWSAYQVYLESGKKHINIDSSLKGTETISFSVVKKGILSAFKIEHSLSPAHDSALIQLIKAGPSWQMLKSGKARATVSLTF